MRIIIRKEELPKEIKTEKELRKYLDFYGFSNPQKVGESEYECDDIGLEQKGIEIVDRIPPYGAVIRKARTEQQMSLKDLSNILLLDPEEFQKVEDGDRRLSKIEIRMISNVLGLSEEALAAGRMEADSISMRIENGLNNLQQLHTKYMNLSGLLSELIDDFKEEISYIPLQQDNELIGKNMISEEILKENPEEGVSYENRFANPIYQDEPIQVEEEIEISSMEQSEPRIK